MKRIFLFAFFFLSACSLPNSTESPGQFPAISPQDAADVIFHDSIVLTMDSELSRAQAVALRGDRIIAVGNDREVMAWQGDQTRLIDLGGRTLMPGFVDAHTHLLNDAGSFGMDLDSVQQLALENGITTIGSMYTTQEFLNEMRNYNAENKLPDPHQSLFDLQHQLRRYCWHLVEKHPSHTRTRRDIAHRRREDVCGWRLMQTPGAQL